MTRDQMPWDHVGPEFSCKDCEILFVFGAARSGTTILNNLLSRHFSYGMGPEGTFLAEWARRLPEYGDLSVDANIHRLVRDIADCRMLYIARHKYRRNPFDVTPELIMARLRERSYAGVVYAVFECMAELQGCLRVGNKNPGYAKHFPVLHRLFPTQAKYLSIVRDGRDVALSIMKTRWGPNSSYIAAKRWTAALAALSEMKRHLGPDRLHVIRYEDLLRQPSETLESVRDFLSIAPGKAAVEAAVRELTQGERAANFDKWKHQMSARNLRCFEGLAGEWLQSYGYQLSGNPATVGRAERLAFEAMEFTRLIQVNLGSLLKRVAKPE